MARGGKKLPRTIESGSGADQEGAHDGVLGVGRGKRADLGIVTSMFVGCITADYTWHQSEK